MYLRKHELVYEVWTRQGSSRRKISWKARGRNIPADAFNEFPSHLRPALQHKVDAFIRRGYPEPDYDIDLEKDLDGALAAITEASSRLRWDCASPADRGTVRRQLAWRSDDN